MSAVLTESLKGLNHANKTFFLSLETIQLFIDEETLHSVKQSKRSGLINAQG